MHEALKCQGTSSCQEDSRLVRMVRIIVLAVVAAASLASSASAMSWVDDTYFVPKGVVGKPYLHVFAIVQGGGSGPYHYRIPRDQKLPPGLVLGEDDGRLTGTPTAPGTWKVWIHGMDSGLQHGFWDMSKELEFTFEILPALTIQLKSPEAAVRDRPYSYRLTAEGGGTQVWSVESGTLPPGISLGPDGTLSGTPTTAGHFTFAVKVMDPVWDTKVASQQPGQSKNVRERQTSGLRSDTRGFILWVSKVGIDLPANLGTTAMVTGKPITPIKLKASGAAAPYTWYLAGPGKLPAGLILDPAQGTIHGTPEAAGSFPIMIFAKDAAGSVGIVKTTLEVSEAGAAK